MSEAIPKMAALSKAKLAKERKQWTTKEAA